MYSDPPLSARLAPRARMDARLAQVSRIVSPFRAVADLCKPLKPLHPSRHFPPTSTPTVPHETPCFSRLPPTRDHATAPLKHPSNLRGSTWQRIHSTQQPFDGATLLYSLFSSLSPVFYSKPARIIHERKWSRRWQRSKQPTRAAARALTSQTTRYCKCNFVPHPDHPASASGGFVSASALAALDAAPARSCPRIYTDFLRTHWIPHPSAAATATVYAARRPLTRVLQPTSATAAASILVSAPAATAASAASGTQWLASGAAPRLRRAVWLAPTDSGRKLRAPWRERATRYWIRCTRCRLWHTRYRSRRARLELWCPGHDVRCSRFWLRRAEGLHAAYVLVSCTPPSKADMSSFDRGIL